MAATIAHNGRAIWPAPAAGADPALSHDLTIAGGVALLRIFHHGINVVIEACCETLPYRSDFVNNRIR